MRSLFVSNEVAPFAKVGGLADVAGSLPPALADVGVNISVVMPLHRSCLEHDGFEVAIESLIVDGPAGARTASVLRGELPGSRVPIYFIRHDPYFDRAEIYGPGGGDYPDAADRFAFLARAVMALVPALGIAPDVIHAHDWPTGLLSAFEALNPAGQPTVFTIHNLAYQGQFPMQAAQRIGIDPHSEAMRLVQTGDHLNYMAAAIRTATEVNTVSDGYAREIQTPAFGEHLDELLHARANGVAGIINGIDYTLWNPAKDQALPAHYSAGAMSGKAICKAALQREVGLPVSPDVPVLGAVTRLAWQKGLDVLAEAMPNLLEVPIQFVLLGTGEKPLEQQYRALARAYPSQIAVRLRYDEALARRIYAGSDLFAMPSRYEPCGLGQMIAMAYGTVPVAHATGGLADTVIEDSKDQTGFVFAGLNAANLVLAMQRAVRAWHSRKTWEALMGRCMAQDFSWAESARKYVALYERAIAAHARNTAR